MKNYCKNSNWSNTQVQRNQTKGTSVCQIIGAIGTICASVYYLVRIIMYCFVNTKGKEIEHGRRMEEEKLKHDNKIAEMDHKEELLRQRHSPATMDTQITDEIPDLKETDLAEWINNPSAELKYFNDTPIAKGDLCLIYSQAGEGKSTLALQIGLSISNGKPTGLFPYNDQVSVPQDVYLYDAEHDEQVYRNRYKNCDLDFSNLHRFDTSGIKNYQVLIKLIEDDIANSDDDRTYIFDNIPAMFVNLTADEVSDFTHKLKAIQDRALSDERVITFIVISHSIKSARGKGTEELAGSVYWSRLFKTVISLQTSKQGDDYKILSFDKSRNAPKGNGILVRRVSEPYLHFEYQEDLGKDVHIPVSDSKTKEDFVSGVPKELAFQIAQEYQKGVNGSGFGSILKNHKTELNKYGKRSNEQVRRIILAVKN